MTALSKNLRYTIALICAALFAHASVSANANTFDNPSKQFQSKGLKSFKQSDTIFVPAVYLHTLVEGKYKRSKGGAHAKANFSVTNLSPAVGEELATAIHDDLVAKLKAAGWKVLTYADASALEGWDKLGQSEPEKKIGVVGHSMNLGFGQQWWMTSTPKGVPAFAPMKMGAQGMPNLHAIFSHVTRKENANLLFPTYRFTAPLPYGSTGRGYKKNKAEVGVEPVLELTAADSGFYSAKGAWGGVTLKQPLRLSENIGELVQVSQSNSKNVSLFNFETFRSIAKGDYSMSLDIEAYKAAVLKAASDYNSILVDELKVAAP